MMGRPAKYVVEPAIKAKATGSAHGPKSDHGPLPPPIASAREPKCSRCGSEDVRWKIQTGEWTLFDTRPGVLHECPLRPADGGDE